MIQVSGVHPIEVPCPSCGQGTIKFLPLALAAGQSFSCSNCFAALALNGEAREVYETSLQKYMKLQDDKAGGV